MNNSKFHVFTEEKVNASLIKALIDGLPNHEDFRLLSAYSFSSLLSKAGTYLITEDDIMVIVISDADSNDEYKINDHEVYIKDILRYRVYKDRLKIIIPKPEIEVVFFNDKVFYEDQFNMKISDNQWKQMQQAPKQYLHFLLDKDQIDYAKDLLAIEEWKQQLLNSEIRKEIEAFYNQVMLLNSN